MTDHTTRPRAVTHPKPYPDEQSRERWEGSSPSEWNLVGQLEVGLVLLPEHRTDARVQVVAPPCERECVRESVCVSECECECVSVSVSVCVCE